jgi:hypothetical protein
LRDKISDATDDSDLASNGPQPFSHIHAPKINLWQHFFGILQMPTNEAQVVTSIRSTEETKRINLGFADEHKTAIISSSFDDK